MLRPQARTAHESENMNSLNMSDSGAAADFRPGSRFRLVRQIGVGGMGTVYEAWDTVRDTRVALKTLTGLNPRALQLFKNEFRTLADVSHPNLASLYELFCEDQWYFSMEYVGGGHFLDYVRGSLARPPGSFLSGDELTEQPGALRATPSQASPPVVQAGGQCDEGRLISVLGQLADAISSLHANGILHRDLKPLNVKVTPEGRVVVLDFGLAIQTGPAYGEALALAGFVGTVPYMSPEQGAGDPVSEATDWYAIGVMVYEALTGRRPFEGDPGSILRDKRLFEAPRARRSGDVSAAWDDLCAGLLARDPRKRLTGTNIIAHLTRGPAPEGAAVRPLEKVFVGREIQLAVLRQALAESESGTPSVVFIRGVSGMGKTTLVEKFLGQVIERHTGRRTDGKPVILAGRCHEKESLPYKAFDSVIDSLALYLADLPPEEAAELTPRDAAALVRIFPVLRQIESFAKAPARSAVNPDQLELRRQAFSALRELLAKLGDRARVVVYIDDLQWGDTDSVLLFREILRLPDAPSFLYIGSYRSEYEGRSAALDTLLAGVQEVAGISPHRMMIGPLSLEEGCTLAARLSNNPNGAGARFEQLARESEGSPYLLQELAAGAGFSTSGSGTSLDTVLFRRIETLSADSRRLLESVAISVRPLREREAFFAAEIAVRDPRVLTELRAGRLIRGVGEEIEPYHDRVRQTILAHVDSGALRGYHFRLATAIEAAAGPDGSVDAEAAAVHFENGGDQTKAGHYYAIAAETASGALAFRHAAQLWQKALDLSPETAESRRNMMVKLADALGNAGRGADAARAYRQAVQIASGPDDVQLERLEAYWFASSGHIDEGREALERMLRRVGFRMPGPFAQLAGIMVSELRLKLRGTGFKRRLPEDIPQPELERIDTFWAASRSMAMVDVLMAVFISSPGLFLALAVGDSYRVARFLIFRNIALAAINLPTGNQLTNLMEVSRQLVAQANDPYLNGFFEFAHGMIHFVSGQWQDSLKHSREAERILSAGCTGVAWELSTLRIFTLWSLLYSGQFRELRETAAVWRDEGLERGDLFKAVSIGAGTLPVCELIADRADTAMDTLESSLALWTRRNYNLQRAVAVFIRTWIHLYRGEAAAAYDLNTREWPELRKSHFLRVSGTRQWLYFGRAQSALSLAVTAPNRQTLLKTAEQGADVLQADDKPFARPLATLTRAGLARIKDDVPQAVKLLQQAAGEFQHLDMQMFAAFAKRRLGELTPGEQGRALIGEADEAMRSEGVVNPARLTDAFAGGFAKLH